MSDSRQANLERVLHAYGGMLSRIAFTYASSQTEREDLTQEIGLALWSALPSFRGDASERTYVARIAHNRGMSFLARRHPTGDLGDFEPEDRAPSPETMNEDRSRQLALLAAVRKLPVGYREVIGLALEELSHEEISETLGLSTSNVAVRLHRAKAMLKKLLEDT